MHRTAEHVCGFGVVFLVQIDVADVTVQAVLEHEFGCVFPTASPTAAPLSYSYTEEECEAECAAQFESSTGNAFSDASSSAEVWYSPIVLPRHIEIDNVFNFLSLKSLAKKCFACWSRTILHVFAITFGLYF